MTVPQPAADTPTIDQARAIAGAGMRVLPIKPGRKNPPMKSWQNAASVEEKAIAAWWNGLYRDHGIGIAMGPQPDGRNLFAIDIDTHDEDANGYDTLADLEAEHGELPATVTSITGSGGSHQIYEAPADIVVRNQQSHGKRIGPGVDVRGDGGQIVVAPTIHPDTQRRYQWATGRAPWEIDVAPAPDWLLDMVAEPPPAPTTPRDPFTGPTASGDSAADILRAQWHWPTELAATGWQEHHTDGDDTYYTRPGKDKRQGHSAVLHGTDGPLVVFTTDIGPELRNLGHPTRNGDGWSFSPLEWEAAHRHNGSLSDASRAIIAQHRQTAPQAPQTAPQADEAPEDVDDALRAMLLDWGEFWATDHKDAEWLAEPIIAAHRSTAIFAPGGTGKSLLALYIAACIATGTRLFGRNTEPRRVLYLDYEMTADDLAERLEQMGFGEDTDLSNLHYALLPSLPGLDEPEGGKAVVRLAELVDADLVIIDTFGRAVHGDENEADTVRAWYRWTGIHLKHAGRAFMRVDHAGKDIAKGQRGTSAKNDDVDVVWQMVAKEGGAFTLTAKKRRMGWVPLSVDIVMTEDPFMRFDLLAGHAWPKGTAEVAKVLDALEVPIDASSRKAAKAFRDAGHKGSSDAIRSAQRYRQERSTTMHFATDEAVDKSPKSAPESFRHTPDAKRAGDDSAHFDETLMEYGQAHHPARSGTPSDADAAQCASLKEAHAPSVAADDPQPDPDDYPDVPF